MAHLSNKTDYRNLRPYIRLNSWGDIIPGSLVLRNKIPTNGTWRELGYINACCNGIGDSIITFRNTTASANITTISTADGRISWSGTLANNGVISFVIPNGMDETFSVTVSSFSGRTLTNTKVQGSGTISAVGSLAALTTTFTTNAVPNTQYTSVLS